MVNILDLLKGQLGSAATSQIAELIGENNSKTSSAINSILPSLLGGLVQKGSTQSGAAGILDFLNKENLDGSMFNNLGDLLGGGSKTSTLMNLGSLALPFILGGKKAGMMSLLGKVTGLGSSSNSTLMNLLGPMVLGMIGKQVKSSNLNAGGLMEMLLGQKKHVKSALPEGMGDLLGFAKETTKATTSTASTTRSQTSTPEPSGGGGFMKYLIPLALLLGAGWFLMNNGCGADVQNTANTAVDAATETVTTTTEAVSDAVNYTVDASGNLVDGTGNVIKKAGEYTKDASGRILDASGNVVESISTKSAELVTEGSEKLETVTTNATEGATKTMKMVLDDAGNLTDGDGKILYNKGEFKEVNGYYVDSKGNRIGKVWAKIKEAVTNAAEKTADFFKGKFGGMFKKEAGASSVYTLSKMEFNPENHKISYFSKQEFEGLAAALKANPDSKISVQVHTDDGENAKESMKLTKMRADQIEMMLETLGVGKKQVSSKGMGAEDAGKASTDAIEIVVQ